MDTLKGAMKSKTVWLGVLVAALSALQSQLNNAGISAEQLGIAGPILGAVMIWLRSISTGSLADKVSK